MNLLAIAARVAHDGFFKNGPTGKKKTRDEFKKEVSDRLSDLESSILRCRRSITELHKLRGKIPSCKWLEMMQSLIEQLKYCKKAHLACELLLLRMLAEPENEKLLETPVP